MIPIIKLTLKQRRSFIIGWSVAIVLLIGMLMAVYPSIRDQAQVLTATIDKLPEALRSLKASNSSDLFSPIGFLNSQLYYATLPLLLGIMSISLGGSLLARDEQDHTIELLLARPISRTRVLLAKALSGTIIVGIVSIASLCAIIILGKFVSLDVAVPKLALVTFYVFLLCLAFGAVAFMLTAVSGLARHFVIGISTLFAFGGYLLASLAGLADWIKEPAKLFPFYYFHPYDILHGNISTTLTVYLLATLAVCSLIAWLGFRSRDLE